MAPQWRTKQRKNKQRDVTGRAGKMCEAHEEGKLLRYPGKSKTTIMSTRCSWRDIVKTQ